MFTIACIILILFALSQGNKARENLKELDKSIKKRNYFEEIQNL